MSLRLIQNIPGSSAKVVGNVNGQSLYELRGAEPVDEEGNEPEEGAELDSEGGGSGTESPGAGEQPVEDVEVIRNRMKAADRRASVAEARIQELENEKLSTEEKREKELGELRTYRDESEKTISALNAKVAFLSVNDVSWQDPAIALSQLDMSTLIGEDGAVDTAALKKAVEKLAKEKPFLVKTATVVEEKKGNDKPAGPSGGGVGSGGGTKKTDVIPEDELRRRYPALYA